MKNTYVIGIAGGSASGKTTFAETLERALGAFPLRALHMDDYYRPEDELPHSRAPVTGAQYLDYNQPLSVDLPRFRGDLEEAINSGKYQIVIAEGLFTLWDQEICNKLDLKLFVECRADERIVRRIKRNMQWGLTYDEISEVYLDLVRYRHDEFVEPSKWRADFILNGSHPSDKAVDMIAAYILRLLKD